MSAAFERILDKLAVNGQVVRRRGPNQATAQCPAHDDHDPSLSVTGTDGRALLYCHAGCHDLDVLAALGMTENDFWDNPRGARYDYTDARGAVLRSVFRTPGKKFRQSGDTAGTPTLYRLPQLIEAVAAGREVYLVEGEKDVHALETLDVVATTAPMGASSFSRVDVEPLRGAHVIAVVDRDKAGDGWAAAVHERLDGVAADVRFVHAAVGKDAADHVAADRGLDEFVPLTIDGVSVSSSRRARITWAIDIEPEPVTWAWEDEGAGRMPAGALSLGAGREGTGKSSFGIWLTAQITRGTLPGAFYGTPRRVLYVAVEDSWRHTLVPRLMAAGADLALVGRFEVLVDEGDEVTLTLPNDNLLFEQELNRHEVALTVIDPVMSVVSEKLDTHKEREVRIALDPLARIADRTASVVFGLAHFNKSSGSDIAQLITGSGAFKNVPRAVFGFARDDDSGERVMTQVKNSLGRDDLPSLVYRIESQEVPTRKGTAVTSRFTFVGPSDMTVADILRSNRSGPDDSDQGDGAETWLRDYLERKGGEATARDVYAAGRVAGHSQHVLKRAKKRARVESRKTGMDGGWLWCLVLDDGEGSTKGTKGVESAPPLPSSPSAPPSASTCITCRQPMTVIEAGQATHPGCPTPDPGQVAS
ncbi:AAA family ATPase [Kineococcus sp. SYSU DK001]|uniref:AAA family ATPase n=1 Tax=Kineococcus sp. SYSU DK001 TaxID=3383122 RepID=UPI003D7E4DB7